MRQVNLAGVFYKLAPRTRVTERAINPFKGRIGGAGGLEYSDFSSASLEEYFDFRNGIGKNRGLGSEARLQFSQGIDFSIEGQAVLGSLVNTTGAASAPSAPTITNADMELDANWTTESGSGVRSNAKNHTAGGTYCWLLDGASVVYQNLTGFATYQNLEVVFTCWVWCDFATIGRIAIDDGVTPTYSSYHTGGSGWEQLTVTRTLNKAATKLALELHCTAPRSAHFDDAAITVTAFAATAPIKIIDFQSATYLINANGIFKWSGSAWTFKHKLATTPIDAIVVTDATDEYLVVSSATESIYSVDGATWIALTGCQGYLAWYQQKLHGIDTDGVTLRSSAANNIDGVWTTFTLVGGFGTVYKLFSGKLLADQTPALYFLGNKGLFSIDVTNELAYQQEVNYPPLTYAGHAGMYWNANIWVATGAGITKIAPSIATPVGTDQDDGLPSTYQGNVYDMLPIGNWLVFCVNGGTTDKSSIFKRSSSLGGNLQVYTTSATNNPIACMHHSPSSLYTNGRLWFGEGTSVKHMMFPDTTSNVKQITTYTYVDDSGYGTFPIFRKLAAIPKVALGVACITKSCDANEYVQVYYGLNGAAATTLLGTFNDSPRDTIATFNSGLGTAFYTIQFAVKLIRGGTTTNSPELESLLFYYYPTPTVINAWTFYIQATEATSDKIITQIEAIRDTATLVAFYPSGDTAKSSYNVKLTNMPLDFWCDNKKTRQGHITVVVEQIFSG